MCTNEYRGYPHSLWITFVIVELDGVVPNFQGKCGEREGRDWEDFISAIKCIVRQNQALSLAVTQRKTYNAHVRFIPY
jgi:hypothetical protein